MTLKRLVKWKFSSTHCEYSIILCTVLLRIGDVGNIDTACFLMFHIFKRGHGAYIPGDGGDGGGT